MELNEFEKLLNAYLEKKRKEMKHNYNRVLPTNELLYNRWEKANFIGAGEQTCIYDSALIMGNVKIGRNVWIGPFTVLEAINDEIIIGDFCHISAGVHIYTHNTVKYVLSNGKYNFETGSVIIGNNCYIGPLSVISKGVKIGNYCVIGANSFVNKDIPSFSVAFGIPARIVGKVILKDDNEIEINYF